MAAAARGWAVALAAVVVGASVVTVPTASQAAPTSPPAPRPPSAARAAHVDRTLGNGLGRLLTAAGPTAGPKVARRQAGGFTFDQEALTIRDARGRVLVDLTPAAGVDRTTFRRSAEAAGLLVQSADPSRGTLEGFVALDDVRALAALPGRGTLAQAVRPVSRVGAATSQGVALQRVDRAQHRKLDGRGVTVAALSDSYDTATTTLTGDPLSVHAADDVASGDLPGPGNTANPLPVAVLQDDDGEVPGTDEGRAMLQVVHDVAPAAKLCFATAQSGEVGYAANIRRLAEKKGACGADVIVDDLDYLDEPMFSDGILSDAVDAVAKQGVHYFSAAGNQGSNQAWDSAVHLVSADEARTTSNIHLDDVDPALYAGGFQDMQPGAGVDVAQDVRLGAGGGTIDLQWDDPVDLDGPTLGTPYFSAGGTVTGQQPAPTFTFTPTAAQLGTTVQFRADGVPSGTTDLVLTVTAPDGTVLARTDDVTSPEVFTTRLDQPGPYTIEVSGYSGETGDFTVDVSPVLEPSRVSTDFNVLFFDMNGTFLGDSADVNALTGRPLELSPIAGAPEVQVVVSRASTGPVGAHRLRSVLFGNAELAEHVDPTDPGIFGHATARGATAVAAYDPFRPFLPEPFTSPGGTVTVTYDSAGDPLPKSRRRRTVPQVAGADGGNTTFFGVDSPADPDDQPNFYGTSAAAPQVAGIAALVVQRDRQRHRTRSPGALRSALEHATFAHDLDPFRSRASVSGVVLTAAGAPSAETDLVPGSMTDPRFFTLRNTSHHTIRSVTLDGSTAGPTALGAVADTPSSGVVFDPRPYATGQPRRTVGFPFTVGGTSGGLDPASVSASYGGATGTGRFATMTLTFAQGLKRGQQLQFGVDRDLARADDQAADEGNSADLLGGAVELPSGGKRRSGLTVVVTRTSGRSAKGRMANKLGSGRTVVDGYGLVDADRATGGH